MNRYTFIKEGEGWYIDFPEYLQEFNKSDLALVEGSDDLLDFLSHGRQSVSITLDTKPFTKAVELELTEYSEPLMAGGYYRMRNQQGKIVQQELWLCDLPLFVFGDIPERIYLRKE